VHYGSFRLVQTIIVVLLIVDALAFVVACTSRVELSSQNLGSKVYFVPTVDLPTDQLKGLTITVIGSSAFKFLSLRAVGVSASDLDSDRGQLVAKAGENCELSTGQPPTNPHRDRKYIAAD
jgi:hypothetical protein